MWQWKAQRPGASAVTKTDSLSAGLTLTVCFFGMESPFPFSSYKHMPCR